MAIDNLLHTENLVTWTLSGTYDEDKPLLIDADEPTRYLTKGGVTQLVARLAGAFRPGETVCTHLSNDILYPVLVLAILASGCRWTGTNPAYLCNELQHHFEKSETTTVIVSSQHLAVVESAVSLCHRPVQIILLSDIAFEPARRDSMQMSHPAIGSSVQRIEDLLAESRKPPLSQLLREVSCDSPATIMSTSGTTGLPKMVQRSHRALILETKAIEDNNSAKEYDIRRLYCTPMFHAFSFPEMVVNTIRLGHPSYYMRRFDDAFSQRIRDFQITETMSAPAMLSRLAHQAMQDEGQRLNLQSLRMVLCAGAPLSAAFRNMFLQTFEHPVRVVQVWGMSEGGWFSTFRYPEVDDTGSVGRAIPGCIVRLLPDRSVRLANGHCAGELLVKAAQLSNRYLGNKEATEESFDKEGWLNTGDIGYINDGKIYLVDRAKDIIKVNAWTVSPAELEATLMEHPEILDAAALGYGNGQNEHPLVFVVAKQSNLSPQDVKNYLLGRHARYKVATCEVMFTNAIPRNPSGKILRKVLRDQMEQGNYITRQFNQPLPHYSSSTSELGYHR